MHVEDSGADRHGHFHKANVSVDTVHAPFGRTNGQAQHPDTTGSYFQRNVRTKFGFIMLYPES